MASDGLGISVRIEVPFEGFQHEGPCHSKRLEGSSAFPLSSVACYSLAVWEDGVQGRGLLERYLDCTGLPDDLKSQVDGGVPSMSLP